MTARSAATTDATKKSNVFVKSLQVDSASAAKANAQLVLTAKWPSQTGAPLYVSAVVHEAAVQVDEQGTVASAQRRRQSPTPSAPAARGGPLTVAIDQPFLVVIRDTRNGSILFMGHVEDPRQTLVAAVANTRSHWRQAGDSPSPIGPRQRRRSGAATPHGPRKPEHDRSLHQGRRVVRRRPDRGALRSPPRKIVHLRR
jgi:hypothetical protein